MYCLPSRLSEQHIVGVSPMNKRFLCVFIALILCLATACTHGGDSESTDVASQSASGEPRATGSADGGPESAGTPGSAEEGELPEDTVWAATGSEPAASSDTASGSGTSGGNGSASGSGSANGTDGNASPETTERSSVTTPGSGGSGAAHVHSPVTDPAVEATCRSTGLTEGSHCSVCGATITAQQVIPVRDHVYMFGACIWCGARAPQNGNSGGGIELPEDELD